MAGRSGAKIIATVLAASLGAGFGNVLYLALTKSLNEPRNWLYLLIVAAIMLLVSTTFIDPLSRLLRALLGIPADETPRPSGRGLWAMFAGSVVSLVWLERVFENFVQNNWFAVALMLATAVLVVGGVTLGWIWGAGSGWRLSGLLGGLLGFLINGAATFAVLLLSHVAPAWQVLAEVSFWSGLSFGFVGFAGGLALDLGYGGNRPSYVASIAAFAMTLLTGAIGIYLATTTVEGVLPNLFLVSGWLLGFIASPYSDEVLSRRPRVTPAAATNPL